MFFLSSIRDSKVVFGSARGCFVSWVPKKEATCISTKQKHANGLETRATMGDCDDLVRSSAVFVV